MKKSLIYLLLICSSLSPHKCSADITIPQWMREVSAESIRTALWATATYYTSTWATEEIEHCRHFFQKNQYGRCLLSALCVLSAVSLMSKSGYYTIQHASNALKKLEGSEKESLEEQEENSNAAKILTMLRISL